MVVLIWCSNGDIATLWWFWRGSAFRRLTVSLLSLVLQDGMQPAKSLNRYLFSIISSPQDSIQIVKSSFSFDCGSFMFFSLLVRIFCFRHCPFHQEGMHTAKLVNRYPVFYHVFTTGLYSDQGADFPIGNTGRWPRALR